MTEFKKAVWFNVMIKANWLKLHFGSYSKWFRDRMNQIATWASYHWIYT